MEPDKKNEIVLDKEGREMQGMQKGSQQGEMEIELDEDAKE